jgi:hypothetical protein
MVGAYVASATDDRHSLGTASAGVAVVAVAMPPARRDRSPHRPVAARAATGLAWLEALGVFTMREVAEDVIADDPAVVHGVITRWMIA